MTSIEVAEQIRIIRKATKNASKSKESAIKFLTDAGILKKEKTPNRIPKAKVKEKNRLCFFSHIA